MNILLLEDDVVLSDILTDFLSESWSVTHAFSSQEVHTYLEQNKYDLFIFDINVTGKNGIELLKELRAYNNHTPTIFITAYTDTSYLKKAFEAGAHDYIKKPFELEELNARILNTKKLFNIENSRSIILDEQSIYFTDSKEVDRNGERSSLSAKDAALLLYFLKNKTRLISNEELSQNVWDFETLPSNATLRSHIRTIREIIGKEKITTIRGEGYIYE